MTIHDRGSGTTDGRQARSERTRAAVAEAMLDCFEDGILQPSAKQVAERAGVSSRAVFRHFESMETLMEQVAALQMERVLSQLPPLESEGSLDERLDGMVSHAARRNEIIAPVRRAALLSEPFSKVIRERHATARAEIRRQVRTVFAKELAPLSQAQRRDRVAALRALFSFSYWEELRRHEKLSTPAASRVLRGAAWALLRE